MKDNNELKSIAKLLQMKDYFLDIDKFEKKIKEHEDYPSLLSYYETFTHFNIECEMLKISENNLDFLPFPFLALIRDNFESRITLVNRINNKYYYFKKERLITISRKQLKNIWLGVIILFIDKDDDIYIEENCIDNVINIKAVESYTKIVGIRNKFKIENKLNNINLHVLGNDNEIIINKGASISNCVIYIWGNCNSILIGNNSSFSGKIWIEGNNSLIKIGKKTIIGHASLSASESKNIEIGNNCLFSENITLKTSDSHSIIDLDTKKRINESGDIIIKDHVWICPFVNILKNVTIESNSVVGTGSLVTKNIEENSLYGGVPAKLIKKSINWNIKLLK